MSDLISRVENILKAMLGQTVTLEKPRSRIEVLLMELMNSIGGDTYTKAEIDNLISALVQEIDWKEPVATYTDLARVYPDAEDGWTASVLDTDIIYRYNGSQWVNIYTLAPLATDNNNGLMSAANYTKLSALLTQSENDNRYIQNTGNTKADVDTAIKRTTRRELQVDEYDDYYVEVSIKPKEVKLTANIESSYDSENDITNSVKITDQSIEIKNSDASYNDAVIRMLGGKIFINGGESVTFGGTNDGIFFNDSVFCNAQSFNNNQLVTRAYVDSAISAIANGNGVSY